MIIGKTYFREEKSLLEQDQKRVTEWGEPTPPDPSVEINGEIFAVSKEL